MPARYSAIVAGIESPVCPSIALAHYFAEQGLHVFIAGRDEDVLRQIASKSDHTDYRVSPVAVDLRNDFDIRHLFEIAGYLSTGLRIAAYRVNDTSHIQPALRFASEALATMQVFQQGSLFFARTPCFDSKRENTDFNTFITNIRGQFKADGIQVFNIVLDKALPEKLTKPHHQTQQTQHSAQTCGQAQQQSAAY